MKRIEQHLRDTMGLDAASIGSTTIHRTVRLRMKSLGLNRIEDYHRLLEGSQAEWVELVESVIVTETWFFRDREPFAAFARLVLEEWLPAHPTAPLRTLSAPCSSGEEAYSLAMALKDAGLPADRFQIDAADISARVLARAERACYGKNSFRGRELDFRDRYFQASKEGFVLNPQVRHCVNFFQGNLLDDNFLTGQALYDFIFCRNLLIYFDRPTQHKILRKIERLLTPTGALFVGPAEQPLALEYGFVSAGITMAFACRKPGHKETPVTRRVRQVRADKLPEPPVGVRPAPVAPRSVGSTPNRLDTKPPQSLTDLASARRLADGGRLEEAARICETHLRTHGASAQAYYLLGLVRDAAGDSNAMDYYRKALYLEPDHYESLLQLSLLSHKNGDSAGARNLRNRAQRLKSKPGANS